MNREIEEMERLIGLNVFTYKDEEKVFGIKGAAKVLYNKGYRKESDVAREIFAEVDGITDLFAKSVIGELEMYVMIAELKMKIRKKYESEGADDEIDT
jgi:hypothetical protein